MVPACLSLASLTEWFGWRARDSDSSERPRRRDAARRLRWRCASAQHYALLTNVRAANPVLTLVYVISILEWFLVAISQYCNVEFEMRLIKILEVVWASIQDNVTQVSVSEATTGTLSLRSAVSSATRTANDPINCD